MAIDLIVDVGDIQFEAGTENVGGVYNAGIVDKKGIASIVNGVITLKAGYRFLDIYVSDDKNGYVANKASEEVDVTGIIQKFTFSSPTLSEQLSKFGEGTSSGEWIFIIREGGDCDTARWLILGGKCKGARMTKGEYKTGVNTGEYKGADFEFTANAQSKFVNVCKNADVSLLFGAAAPVAVGGAPIATTSFTANWTAVAGVDSYQLDVSTSASFLTFVAGFNNKAIANPATISDAVTGLTSGTTYYYRLRSVKSSVPGSNSNIVSVTTA